MKDKIIRLAKEYCFFCAIAAPILVGNHYIGFEYTTALVASLILFNQYSKDNKCKTDGKS